MANKSVKTTCFWCKKEMDQRIDTYTRQDARYGHSCCKHCFGNEQTFRDARKRVMLENNPFKGKTHSAETKAKLSVDRMGALSWNKGLTKETSEVIKNYSEKVRLSKAGKQNGADNPNWKGGISKRNYKIQSEGWAEFRQSIIDRDCYSCWKCQDKRRLEVHHIISRTRHKEYEHDEENCIVLCYTCHKKFHSQYGIKRFIPSDTIRFLNEGREKKDFVVFC